MHSDSSLWIHPQELSNRSNPSIILFLPFASGSLSIRRIIQRLIVGQYVLRETDLDVAVGRGSEDTYRIKPTGHVYIFVNPITMRKAIIDSGYDVDELAYLVCLRDPRDMLVSLYYLVQDSSHLSDCEGQPFHQQMIIAAQEAAAVSVDQYVLERSGYYRSQLEELRTFLADVPAERVKYLSYAMLCLAFPRYLSCLVMALNAHPSRHTLAELLITEDVQRPKTLTKGSLPHCPKASPLPGRHKRDLKPESVRRLLYEFRSVLAWMADIDLPEFRELYT